MAKDKNQKASPAVETTALVPDAPGGALAQEDFSEFEGGGEGLDVNDLLITRFRVVQGMTRAKKKNRDMRDGDVYNTLTGKSYTSLVIVPIHEVHHVVERENNLAGKFLGTLPLSGDKRVERAKKANNGSFIKLLSTDRDPPTKLNETRDLHVAILEEDGLTFREFGVIQGESTNLMPLKVYKNERVAACAPKKLPDGSMSKQKPSFALRAVVTTEAKTNQVKDDKGGESTQESYIYKITPFGGTGKWSDAFLRPSVPDELELLQRLKVHQDQVKSGLLKTDYRGDDGEDETADEDANFDPDDDGRPSTDTTGSAAEGDAVDPENF